MKVGHSSMRRRAYTLIELLLALALMAVIATIVVPSFFRSYLEHRAMDQSVSQVMESMLTARQLAIRTATPYVYEFTPGTNRQRVFPLIEVRKNSEAKVDSLPSSMRLENARATSERKSSTSNRAIFREDGSTEGIEVVIVGPTESQAIEIHRRLGIPQRVVRK